MHCVLQVCRALRAEADIAWQRLSLTELTLRYSVRLFAVVTSRQVQPASLQMPACSVVAASQECTRHSCRCLLEELDGLHGTFKHRYHQDHQVSFPYVCWGGAALQ